MIKRSTWLLLLILVLSVAVYLIINKQNATLALQSTPSQIADTYLINEQSGNLQNILIVDKLNTVVELRRAGSDIWNVVQPVPGIADLSQVGAAETQINALRIVSTLSDQLSLGEAGLDNPDYSISLVFSGNIQHLLKVGAKTLSNSGYYVQDDNGKNYVISQAGIDALLKLLTAPPYAATQTPLSTPSETQSPTTDLEITPNP